MKAKTNYVLIFVSDFMRHSLMRPLFHRVGVSNMFAGHRLRYEKIELFLPMICSPQYKDIAFILVTLNYFMEKMAGAKIVYNFCVDTFYEFLFIWVLGTPGVLEAISKQCNELNSHY